MIVRVLAGVAVIALLVAGWLTVTNEQSAPPPVATVHHSANPGYAAQDAVLIETGQNGRPLYTLHASEVRQHPASGTVHLVDVQLQFRDPSGRIWNGRANQGLVANGAANVELSGAVTLSGRLPSDQRPVSISTDRLSVNTHTEVVTTQDPVVLEWNGQKLFARGLIAHLKEERLELKSDVHGLYSP